MLGGQAWAPPRQWVGPPGGEEPSQALSPALPTAPQGSHLPAVKSPKSSCEPQTPALPSSLSPPPSLRSSHTGLLTVPPTHQAQPCPRAFARCVPFAWKTLLSDFQGAVSSLHSNSCCKLTSSHAADSILYSALFVSLAFISSDIHLFLLFIFCFPNLELCHEGRSFRAFCSPLCPKG